MQPSIPYALVCCSVRGWVRPESGGPCSRDGLGYLKAKISYLIWRSACSELSRATGPTACVHATKHPLRLSVLQRSGLGETRVRRSLFKGWFGIPESQDFVFDLEKCMQRAVQGHGPDGMRACNQASPTP